MKMRLKRLTGLVNEEKLCKHRENGRVPARPCAGHLAEAPQLPHPTFTVQMSKRSQ